MRRSLFPLFAVSALALPAAVAAAAQLPPPLVREPADLERPPAVANEESVFGAPAATLQEQIVELVNIERARCTSAGCPLPPVHFLPLLNGVADEHSESMAIHDFFSHYDPSDGCSSPFQRMTAAGYLYSAAGENVAAGNSTAAATMAQWMGSAGHRANILGAGFRELGVGYYGQTSDQSNIHLDVNGDCDCTDSALGETCNGGPWRFYWTQTFGARVSTYPLVVACERHAVQGSGVPLYVYGPATALEMRFSNDGASWSAWRPYAARTNWELPPGDGQRTVYSEVRTVTTTYASFDTVWRDGAADGAIFVDDFECGGASAWSGRAP